MRQRAWRGSGAPHCGQISAVKSTQGFRAVIGE
jgi:hypothetical protein